MVGPEFTAVVCTMQAQVDVLPIWVDPLFVTNLIVALKDLMLAIASNKSARAV